MLDNCSYYFSSSPSIEFMAEINSLWIDLHCRSDDLFIDEYHRPYNEFYKIHFPDEQTPQMIMLIGDKWKTEAMNNLQPSLKSTGSHNGIHLHLLAGDTSSRSPVLLADCELHKTVIQSKAVGRQLNAGITQRALLWRRKVPMDTLNAQTLAHLVYSKLMSPFSNIMCLFADDLGGTGAVIELLASWVISLNSRSSDLPASTFPRVLILKICDHSSFDEEWATIHFMRDLARVIKVRGGGLGPKPSGKLTEARLIALLKQQFGGLRILALPNVRSQSPSQKPDRIWESLWTRILRGSQNIQDRRCKVKVAFSANHFQAFFHLACDHFARDIVTPFSFIKASRLANPLPRDFSTHITNFLEHLKPAQIEPFANPLIASALTFDGYPPEMHDFPPESIFQAFYYDVLRDVNIMKEKIKTRFCQQVKGNTDTLIDTAVTHKAVLSRFKDEWRGIFDNRTCLTCIARAPENHTLDCRHSLCTPCVVTFGLATLEEPWNFLVNPCPLCSTANKTRFLLKPYTAGIRCIVLNGSLGDVFAAKCLQELQERLELRMPIEECFDIAFGTGSGAATLLGLFYGGLSFSQCNALSEFTSHARSLLQTLPRTTASEQYSSTRINHSIKKVFGPEGTLFDCSGKNTNIAVVVTSVHDSSTHIFSTYNGPAVRPDECGHRLLRPQKPKDEILLWQAFVTTFPLFFFAKLRSVRAAIATPPLLRSFHGYYRHEGQESLRHIAFWEQDFLWSRKNKHPDVFLSLGPKTEILTTANREPHFHQQSLENLLTSVTDSLVASFFYIELAGLPLLDKVGYTCRINILCRLLPSEPHLKTLIYQLHSRRACFHYGFQTSIPCVDQELFKEIKDGLAFSKCIETTVLSLDNVVDIKIDGIIRGRSISNCPYTVNDIMSDQGLNCSFGNRDHRRRYRGISRDMPFRQRFI